MNKNLYAGFTLAEVLITLGIIGVVAAMTIPTLIANTRSQQYRAKFKKTISTLSQAARMNQAQYGFDYAGLTDVCTKPDGASDHPESKRSICAIFNGALAGATYFNNISDIPMKKNNLTNGYDAYSPYISNFSDLGTSHAYVLSDGTIVAFYDALGTYPCELEVGKPLEDHSYATTMGGCFGFIDVNGTTLPNKEVSCVSGSSSLSNTSCVVKNDAKHMTDIFPIRFHDGIVEPATAAARYVLRTSK